MQHRLKMQHRPNPDLADAISCECSLLGAAHRPTLPDQTAIKRITGTLLLEVATGRPSAPQRKRMRKVAEVQAPNVENIPRGSRVSRIRAHLSSSTGHSASCCAVSLQGRHFAALQRARRACKDACEVQASDRDDLAACPSYLDEGTCGGGGGAFGRKSSAAPGHCPCLSQP